MTTPKIDNPRQEDNPLKDVITRLWDAHRIWREAYSDYYNPRDFRIKVNSCIQELRNVTFVLQKNKSVIPEFDKWYSNWQEKMRQDPIMKWLIQARNIIVKQGDLDTSSTVRCSVITGYMKPPITEFEVNPLTPTHDIAKHIKVLDLPDELKRDSVLAVERRWVAKDHPDHEILEVLAYTFHFLLRLVDDALLRCGLQTMSSKNRNGDSVYPEFAPCMVATDQKRTIWIKIESGEIVDPEMQHSILHRRQLEATSTRYDIDKDFFSENDITTNLEVLAETFFRIAKRILRKDGYHGYSTFLITPDKKWKTISIGAEDRAEKYIFWRYIASEVKKIGADAIITIGEAWGGKMDSQNPNKAVFNFKNRKELLFVDAESANGEKISISVEFYREGKYIKFGPTKRDKLIETNYIEPVRAVWRENKKL